MAKCDICGKGVTFGIKVSHSHRRSNRTWKPNVKRVKAIVNELGNEQIDIIEWDSNSAQLIVNALSPAKVVSAVAEDEEKKAKIVVSEQQLSLAIGKQGQNVRLAAKLTGYGIDIKSEAEPEEHTEEENLEEEYVEPSEISLDEE